MTIAQVLKRNEKDHPVIVNKLASEGTSSHNNKLMKVKIESALPKEVIERIEELSGVPRPKLVSTYDEINYRILVNPFKKCLIKKGIHNNSTVYFMYDIKADILEQHCWNEECQKSTSHD